MASDAPSSAEAGQEQHDGNDQQHVDEVPHRKPLTIPSSQSTIRMIVMVSMVQSAGRRPRAPVSAR
jgi:hypothetical protein